MVVSACLIHDVWSTPSFCLDPSQPYPSQANPLSKTFLLPIYLLTDFM